MDKTENLRGLVCVASVGQSLWIDLTLDENVTLRVYEELVSLHSGSRRSDGLVKCERGRCQYDYRREVLACTYDVRGYFRGR